MSYLVKSPVTKNVKFAHIYVDTNSANITINASSTLLNYVTPFTSINASSGIGISLSSGNILLANKKYIVYNTPNLKVSSSVGAASPTLYGVAKLYLNDTLISNQIYAGNGNYDNSTLNTVSTPNGFSTFVASQNDVLSLKIDFDNKTGTAVTTIIMGNTTGTPHSLFLWEIDL